MKLGAKIEVAPDREQSSAVANKSDIFVLSSNEKHLVQVSQALKSFYVVHSYNNPKAVIEALSQFNPTAMIIDHDFSKIGGLAFLENVRKIETAKLIPVVFTNRKGDLATIEACTKMPCVRSVTKPYRFSNLLTAISDQVNAHIESTWEMMENTQREALQNTLQSFNSIADQIAEGDSIDYQAIQGKCSPLVDAVQSGDFKDLLQGIRGHDNYSYVHSMRVATFLSLFGDHLGIKGNDLSILATGGLLHDVGKMLIPHQVLNKPGRLEEDELVVMRSHVTETIDFLEKTHDIPRGVGIIAAQHHEKLDGTGYPFGLKGTELNELARMASIIDVFSALTDRRCYKEPMSPVKAMDIMENMEGHLDQHFLRSFKELLLDAASTGEFE